MNPPAPLPPANMTTMMAQITSAQPNSPIIGSSAQTGTGTPVVVVK